MNNDAINKHLAEKVMGWTTWIATKNGYDDLNDAYTDGVKHKIEIAGWNPSENINQVMMCLDKLSNDYTINKRGIKKYECWLENHEIGSGWKKSLPMAICLACAKATGWKRKDE